jgi:hypothetical protein
MTDPDQDEQHRQRRMRALEDLKGLLPGVYPPGYLDALHAEWDDLPALPSTSVDPEQSD